MFKEIDFKNLSSFLGNRSMGKIQKRVASLSSEIGARLRRLRNESGMTQKELAAKIFDGVDYTYIGKIERGQQLPSLKVLLKLSETFSVPIEYFFRKESETTVYVSSPSGLSNSVRDGKGHELIKALDRVHPSDLQLIVEIINILARHRNLEKEEKFGESLSPPAGGNLMPSINKSQVRKNGDY